MSNPERKHTSDSIYIAVVYSYDRAVSDISRIIFFYPVLLYVRCNRAIAGYKTIFSYLFQLSVFSSIIIAKLSDRTVSISSPGACRNNCLPRTHRPPHSLWRRNIRSKPHYRRRNPNKRNVCHAQRQVFPFLRGYVLPPL